MWYRTGAERALRPWRLEIEATDELRARFNRERTELDATAEGLSPPLRARIERFRALDSDFRWRWEAQELISLVDADRIAAFLRRKHGWDAERVPENEAREAVEVFMGLSWDEQKARTPDLADWHGAVSLAGACDLAFALLVGRPV